ncbi:MAG: hypothetical protein KA536_11590 [Saprospiraceae bacterium]|nr:hypothetical protein [Saprospiraceae bacterium]
MSSRKRNQLKQRKVSAREIKEALEIKRLETQFISAMTYNKQEIRARNTRVRLRLPDQANLSSNGRDYTKEMDLYKLRSKAS